jgi:GNAT superfamily N-acetyltransferase
VDRARTIEAELLARCHANTLEDYRAFARATRNGAIEESSELALIFTGDSDSMGNPAFVTRRPDDPVAVVRRAESFFGARKAPWMLLTFPEATEPMRPAARAAGLRDEGDFPGMILHPLPGSEPAAPSGFSVRPAESMAELEALERTGAKAYGKEYSPPESEWLGTPGVTLYVGYLEDDPVSIGALIVAHRVAGIAYIGTAPEHRRRGFAEGIVWRAVRDGRALGCDAAYLWATPMGRGVYERMGFRRILDYHIWTAPHSPLPEAIRRAKRPAGDRRRS